MNTTYETMEARRRRIIQGAAPLDIEDLEYWGERFRELSVRFWTGARFERYLDHPSFWERRAEEARAAHRNRPVITVIHMHRGRLARCRVSMN